MQSRVCNVTIDEEGKMQSEELRQNKNYQDIYSKVVMQSSVQLDGMPIIY